MHGDLFRVFKSPSRRELKSSYMTVFLFQIISIVLEEQVVQARQEQPYRSWPKTIPMCSMIWNKQCWRVQFPAYLKNWAIIQKLSPNLVPLYNAKRKTKHCSLYDFLYYNFSIKYNCYFNKYNCYFQQNQTKDVKPICI